MRAPDAASSYAWLGRSIRSAWRSCTAKTGFGSGAGSRGGNVGDREHRNLPTEATMRTRGRVYQEPRLTDSDREVAERCPRNCGSLLAEETQRGANSSYASVLFCLNQDCGWREWTVEDICSDVERLPPKEYGQQRSRTSSGSASARCPGGWRSAPPDSPTASHAEVRTARGAPSYAEERRRAVRCSRRRPASVASRSSCCTTSVCPRRWYSEA